jgi:hypothetical protein
MDKTLLQVSSVFPCQSPFNHCPTHIYRRATALIMPHITSLTSDRSQIRAFLSVHLLSRLLSSSTWRRVVWHKFNTYWNNIMPTYCGPTLKIKKYVPLKLRCPPKRLHCVTTQKFIIWKLTNQKASKLIPSKTELQSRTPGLCYGTLNWIRWHVMYFIQRR